MPVFYSIYLIGFPRNECIIQIVMIELYIQCTAHIITHTHPHTHTHTHTHVHIMHTHIITQIHGCTYMWKHTCACIKGGEPNCYGKKGKVNVNSVLAKDKQKSHVSTQTHFGF